jgi:hypothetical protein
MKNIHILPTNKLIQNIYITSDEKPKHLDYYITKIKDSNGERYSVGQRLDTNDSDYSNCKKIILTTDQDLIKDGVQAIDDEFLEWFVKNPSCEFVEVDLWTIEKRKGEYFNPPLKEYEIIIPQEEPKQETLEEAAENMWLDPIKNLTSKMSFKAGAKWQQEQDKIMYSKEDMRNAFDSAREFNSLDGVVDVHIVLPMGGDMSDLQPLHFTFDEWFKQFKKK